MVATIKDDSDSATPRNSVEINVNEIILITLNDNIVYPFYIKDNLYDQEIEELNIFSIDDNMLFKTEYYNY